MSEAPPVPGVPVRVRRRGPRPPRPGELPRRWALVLAAAALFYAGAHLSIVLGVWPVHGTPPGAGATLLRDALALAAWLGAVAALRWARYRGDWGVVVLPVALFLLARPALFQVFTDPVYQAPPAARAEATARKAERAQLTTILRAYDEARQARVFAGPPPRLPAPLVAAGRATVRERARALRLASLLSVLLAPATLVGAVLWARRSGRLERWRDGRRLPFALTLGAFFVLALFFTDRGKVAGTTPWELFLPIFVGTWAAVLADDAYNLGRPQAALAPRRLAGLLLYGALPLVPFLLIRELGLSVVLAGSLAAMLLVATRRGWWAALLVAVWAVLVVAAFRLDERAATRFQLAYHPYRDPATMTPAAAQAWAAKLHQFKLFDANVLDGGWWGDGAGRGHGETAPNAADDGFVTLFAAQWGWAGGVALAALYTLFLVRMLTVAARERAAFGRALAVGLTMLLALPFWMAFLGGVRVVPLTGVAAAFVAHGGAKLLASALAVGWVAALSHRQALADAWEPTAAPPGESGAVGVRVR